MSLKERAAQAWQEKKPEVEEQASTQEASRVLGILYDTLKVLDFEAWRATSNTDVKPSMLGERVEVLSNDYQDRRLVVDDVLFRLRHKGYGDQAVEMFLGKNQYNIEIWRPVGDTADIGRALTDGMTEAEINKRPDPPTYVEMANSYVEAAHTKATRNLVDRHAGERVHQPDTDPFEIDQSLAVAQVYATLALREFLENNAVMTAASQ